MLGLEEIKRIETRIGLESEEQKPLAKSNKKKRKYIQRIANEIADALGNKTMTARTLFAAMTETGWALCKYKSFINHLNVFADEGFLIKQTNLRDLRENTFCVAYPGTVYTI